MVVDIINIGLALLTIGLGGIGLVSPRYTADALDLQPAGSTMGLSELRASAGGLFVALGAFSILSGLDWAYAALGIAYAGAAAGRLASIVLDGPPMPKTLIWFLFELVPAVWLISVNL